MNTSPARETRWAAPRAVLIGMGLAAATLGLTGCTDEVDTSTVISDGSVVSSTSTTIVDGSDLPQINGAGTPAPFTIGTGP